MTEQTSEVRPETALENVLGDLRSVVSQRSILNDDLKNLTKKLGGDERVSDETKEEALPLPNGLTTALKNECSRLREQNKDLQKIIELLYPLI